jgi:hypothetical protein
LVPSLITPLAHVGSKQLTRGICPDLSGFEQIGSEQLIPG